LSDRISLATQRAVSWPSSWPDAAGPPQCALYRPLVSGRTKTARGTRRVVERADSLQRVVSAVQLRLLCSSRHLSVGSHCEVSMRRGAQIGSRRLALLRLSRTLSGALSLSTKFSPPKTAR
jgi:hypothetical protein